MGIVAISQSVGSLGDEVGRKLAESLSCEFADREIILEAAERFGQEVEKLEHFTDERPTLWERFSESKERYLAYVEAIVWELAARDNVVLSGRGAPFVLRDVRHALRVRITAPAGLRARRVEQQGLAPEAAAHAVQHNDRERASRVRFLFHAEVDDPLLYDLVLNTDRLEVNAAARLIQEALRSERFRPTPDAVAEIRDRSLAAHARAALLAHPLTRQLQLSQLSLSCKDGHLSISGIVDSEELEKAAVDIVGGIPGVVGVRSEIRVIVPHPHVAGI